MTDILYRMFRLHNEPHISKETFIKRLMPCVWFLPTYLVCFFMLEHMNLGPYYIIGSRLDNYIPFNEYFIVFYDFWFLYCFLGVVATGLLHDGHDYYRLIFNMFTGMAVFILISIAFPNYLGIRHTIYTPENIFQYFVQRVQLADTPKNVFPSIHVFNSLCVTQAITKNRHYRRNKPFCILCWMICFGIIASTLFLKQHSVIDATAAIVMQMVLYPFLYGRYSSAGDKMAARMTDRELI